MWEKIVNILSNKLTSPQYESWIKPIKYLKTDDRNIYVAVPNEYVKNWIKKNLSDQISEAIKEVADLNLVLKIEVDSSLEDKASKGASSKDLEPALAPKKAFSEKQIDNLRQFHKNLNLKYTFDTFVVGANNKFAYAIAKAVGENPGTLHNPLFIYGGVGLGKTHLMQAIGHQAYFNKPGFKIRYSSTENFMNELIESIRRRTSSDFRASFRTVDMLLLDDVQFLEGKEATQDELFYTFNALHEAGKQLVFSSDRPPKQIPNLAERLVSRFEWGIGVDIQPPGYETRIAILRNKAILDKMSIPDDVLQLIASAYQNNIRELEGALNRVIAFVGVTGCPMNVESVRSLIESTSKTRQLTPDSIIEKVAEFYKVTPSDIKGSSRMKEFSKARQIAIYATREITQLSFPNIGEVFGKKHSTIIYAYEKVKEEISANRTLSIEVNEVLSSIT